MARKLSWDVTTTQVNLALHPFRVAKPSTSFGWGKGGKVTSARWQVRLCDPIWRVISHGGEMPERISISVVLRFTFTFSLLICPSPVISHTWLCAMVLYRPYFTYWVTFVQLTCFFFMITVYGLADVGFHYTNKTGPVSYTHLTLPTKRIV